MPRVLKDSKKADMDSFPYRLFSIAPPHLVVGNQGNFDFLARKALRDHKEKRFPNLKYSVVLPYMPGKKDILHHEDMSDTIFPEELAGVPRQLAIDRRNHWMLERSDLVITYVHRPFGGAAKFHDLARKQGKTVLNVHEKSPHLEFHK